jgi:uncharacterized protein YwqG
VVNGILAYYVMFSTDYYTVSWSGDSINVTINFVLFNLESYTQTSHYSKYRHAPTESKVPTSKSEANEPKHP